MNLPSRIGRASARRASFAGLLLCGILVVFGTCAHADWQIPAGANVQLTGGHIGLGGTDLLVSGTLGLGSGSVDLAGAVSINPGGVIDAGSGLIELAGTWSNFGSFLAGSSVVQFVDGIQAQAGVSGDSVFHNLSFVSATGKAYIFSVGTTQGIDGLLTILGSAAPAIQMASSTAGQVAYINLLPTGSQSIANVGVSDVHAIGQPLAPDQSNQGGSGNDLGWFGNTVFVAGIPLPTLSPVWLAILALLLIVMVTRQRRAMGR
ncbi:hypothetical protein [Dokdonella sp.]|uniref:hypothetical protein n=1 Tax=Dokdonella sp. TaxID=2291710 RepID=UPI003C3B0083